MVRLRELTLADVSAVLELERCTAEAPHWGPAVYREAVRATGDRQGSQGAERRVIVAVCASEDGHRELLAGFAGGVVVSPAVLSESVPPRRGTGELETLVVAAAFRRQRVGRALCAAMLAWMREAGVEYVKLEVRASSVAPITLYRSLGFAEQGRRPRYYSNPVEDAILMGMQL